MIYLNFSTKAVERAEYLLSHIGGGIQVAIKSATNRTLEGMRTDFVRETSARYYKKPGEIRKSISLKPAKAGSIGGFLSARSRRFNINEYMAKKFPISHGIMGAVKKDGLKHLPNVFLISYDGRELPFVRKNGKMQIVMSPSIPQIMKNEEILEVVTRHAEDTYKKRLAHEVRRILNGWGGVGDWEH